MDLKDLKYLVALADTGHFGRAAERAFVSQPTLSAQLKKLENDEGTAMVGAEQPHSRIVYPKLPDPFRRICCAGLR
jgi:hypothetical protein